MLIFLIIQQIVCWKTQPIDSNYNNCQAFEDTTQSECSTKEIKIFKVDSYFFICLITEIQNSQFKSLLFTDQSNSQYYVTLVKNQLYLVNLPFSCNNNIKKITTSQEIYNYSMTNDDTSIYIFGGFEGTTLTNNLYKFTFSDLMQGNYNSNLVTLPNNYIVNISVALQLWDGTSEDYVFVDNIPSICEIKNLKYTAKVNSDQDSNSCSSTKTPFCSQNAVLVYQSDCNALQLFYGIDENGNVRNESWTYYLEEQVWESNTQDDIIKMSINPVGINLKLIDTIGFYGGNKYFFYYEENWYDNYEVVNFGSEFIQIIAYENTTFLLNSTTILYSANTDPHIVSQQYGIYLCEDDYHGFDCQTPQSQCPGSVCFNDLLYERICVNCSGHGTCQNGKCTCDDGYDGNDCSNYVKCLNDCSQTGQCINYFPLSQCRCNQQLKRGGEDCSTLFCLNDCSNNGKCLSGACTCNSGSKGDDCSILDLKFIDE